jgi:hypothetical protein
VNFVSGVNWETVLVASIVPVIGLIGILYNDFRKKKNASIDTAQAVAVKREPTWVELEESNRSLRAEMAVQKKDADQRIADLEARFDTFETKTNVRIGALSNMLHASARQWPETHPGPYFEAEDLAALENTDVPYVWRNRIRPIG